MDISYARFDGDLSPCLPVQTRRPVPLAMRITALTHQTPTGVTRSQDVLTTYVISSALRHPPRPRSAWRRRVCVLHHGGRKSIHGLRRPMGNGGTGEGGGGGGGGGGTCETQLLVRKGYLNACSSNPEQPGTLLLRSGLRLPLAAETRPVSSRIEAQPRASVRRAPTNPNCLPAIPRNEAGLGPVLKVRSVLRDQGSQPRRGVHRGRPGPVILRLQRRSSAERSVQPACSVTTRVTAA